MGKTCTHEFFKNAQIALVLRTCAILYVFEKLTRACFSQIALETILLPLLIKQPINGWFSFAFFQSPKIPSIEDRGLWLRD